VVGVETHGAASFYASHTAGEHVGIPEIDTIAKSLGAKKISKFTYDLSRRHSGHVSAVLVSDAQAANATWRFAGDHSRSHISDIRRPTTDGGSCLWSNC
jgi:L-serine/L-threonine ammonia-lyase